MFAEESLWIRDVLSVSYRVERGRALDIGSADREFRERVQPHIAANVHAPLLARGWRIAHLDLDPGPGVDYAVDLCAGPLTVPPAGETFDLVLCCNILEHVRAREPFLDNVARLVRPGGRLLVTVPKRYPRHDDPIDTMYRPGIRRLVADVARAGPFEVREAGVIPILEPGAYARRSGRRLERFMPWRTYPKWRRWLAPMRWQVACVLFERRGRDVR